MADLRITHMHNTTPETKHTSELIRYLSIVLSVDVMTGFFVSGVLEDGLNDLGSQAVDSEMLERWVPVQKD